MDPQTPVPDVIVRDATTADADAIAAFQRAMARETEGKSLDGGLLQKGVSAVFGAPGKGGYLVAEAEGRVVGSLLITFEWSDWRNATFWWIQSVFVDAQWRRKGVYRALHKHVLETACADGGVCGVRLYVDRDNHGAQQTYQSLGMTRSHYDMYEVDFVL